MEDYKADRKLAMAVAAVALMAFFIGAIIAPSIVRTLSRNNSQYSSTAECFTGSEKRQDCTAETDVIYDTARNDIR